MNRFDEELHSALRRVEPPVGFAERVLARVEREETPQLVRTVAVNRRWWQMPVVRWAAAAAMVVGAIGGTYEYRAHREEQARGREAKEQVLLALKITGSKYQFAHEKVQQLSRGERP